MTGIERTSRLGEAEDAAKLEVVGWLGPLPQPHPRQPETLLASDEGQALLAVYAEDEHWEIGRGDDAVVLARHGTGRVVRICQKPEPFEAFLAFCGATPSPHLPRIFSHARRGTFAVTEMERLAPIALDDHAAWEAVAKAAALAHAVVDQRPLPVRDFKALPDSLIVVAKALGAEALRRDYLLDFAVGNVLRRPRDGAIVFTDVWGAWL